MKFDFEELWVTPTNPEPVGVQYSGTIKDQVAMNEVFEGLGWKLLLRFMEQEELNVVH
jgi:hypothetical protein